MSNESRLPVDEFHQHEVLHTASIIASMFEQFIVEHHYTNADPDVKSSAEDIAQRLHDFYQLVGTKSLS